MLKFIPLINDNLQNAAIAALLPQMEQAMAFFYQSRPDCGTFEESSADVKAGRRVAGIFVHMDTGAFAAGAVFERVLFAGGFGILINAYAGKLSDYIDSAAAFEDYARELGASWIETESKPTYALQNTKLGYDVKKVVWHKNLRAE